MKIRLLFTCEILYEQAFIFLTQGLIVQNRKSASHLLSRILNPDNVLLNVGLLGKLEI